MHGRFKCLSSDTHRGRTVPDSNPGREFFFTFLSSLATHQFVLLCFGLRTGTVISGEI